MCERDIVATQVRLAKPHRDGRTHAPVDPCIAPLVQALNDAGIETMASCCGHGRRPGNIALADGRELIIAANYDEGRAIDRAFPSVNGE